VTADVPEIYMQEFWATAYVRQHSIRFKIDSKKNIVDLEAFREMLHISPRVPGQSFDELPFKEEILDFFVINKCLTGKSFGFDRLRLSQAQILWGLYHKRNIDYAFLIWKDFMYQVEHKNQKKSNEMYYPRFTKVIIHHFMTKKPSIPRRNKVNWHYVRDDILFSTIKVVSRHQNTQQYGVILPIELTTKDIRNTKAYKEYYACATGEAAPKPKASARRKRSDSDTSITPPTTTPTPITTVAPAPRLTAATKGKQPARAKSPYDPSEHGGSSIDEGTGSKAGVPNVPSDDSEKEISWNSSDDEDVDAQDKDRNDDEGDQKVDDDDDDDKDDAERDDDDDDNDDVEEIAKIDEPEDTESGEGDAEETKSDEESAEEETREEEEESFDPIPITPEDSEDDDKCEEDQGLRVSEEQRLIEEEAADELYRDQESSSVSSFVTSMLNSISDADVESIFMTASSLVAPLPTPIPTMTPSIITTTTTASHPPIPPTPIPIQVAVQIQTDRLHDSYQRENDEFLKTIDDNMKRIIKEQVKSQVKDQVSRILPRIEQSVNAQLKSKVLTRSSHSSRTSYAVAADLTKMELKKILIEKMEGNKSIQRSDEQRNLYKALVDAYEADKTILDSYGDTAILKRKGGDDDDQEGPSAGSDRGSKRRREGGEPESASTPSEPATRSASSILNGFPSRGNLQHRIVIGTRPCCWISELAKQADSRFSFKELLDTLIDFSNFIMNRLGVDTLTPELLAGPTYELMRGSCTSLTELEYHLEEPLPLIPDNRGRRVIPFAHFINNDLEYLRGGASSRKYTTSVTKEKAADYGHIKWIEDLVSRTMWIQEPLNYDKHALWGRRIIAVTDLKIVEWHNYKHLDWISVRRDDDKIYKFKEGDFKRLRFQDIEDMLLMLVQGKLSCGRFQLGVESYQKRLNLTKPDTYRFDLKRREAYTAYSNPRGFIYQNKDKKNRLMRIDELHKFSDGTLNDVRNALDDRLKGIRMQYLPKTILRKGDKDRAAAMIQAIDKMLKTKRIMRSLERFVGGRLYERDFRMLQGPYDSSYAAPIFTEPLPLIPDNRGHYVIPFAHFINNDLEYLRRGASSRKYTTSVTKTKEADYGHIKWIEDLVPRTMTVATMIEQQVVLDKALVPSTKRLRIGRSNFRLPSDIQSKDSTLQVLYDVLRGCPFFKAFLVTADVPEIYMQEFWATAYVHQYSIRFKMDSKKNIVDLEAFRQILHISPRVPGQSFDELP
nr:hypothetical protein [Tanacetum cinerariifolium]